MLLCSIYVCCRIVRGRSTFVAFPFLYATITRCYSRCLCGRTWGGAETDIDRHSEEICTPRAFSIFLSPSLVRRMPVYPMIVSQ